MTTKDLINNNRSKIEGIVNMTTAGIIKSMLVESTGVSFLDSGGSDGRHWQKNQGRDFSNEPEIEIDCNWMREGDRIDFTVNVYHYLVNNLTSDEITDEFNSRFNHMQDWNGYGYGLSVKASEWLINNFRVDPEDLSNDWINTYNYDSNLSQVLQYRYIGDGYIILQVHNGADVRGGYTDAKLFRLIGDGLYEGVYGMITYPDGRGVDVDTMYNGWSLTTEDGVEVLYEEGMIVDLNLIEC